MDRRRALQLALVASSLGAFALPAKWVKPVMEFVVVPAHAAASPATTTTVAPTTTTAGTTTAAPTTTAAATTTAAPTTTPPA